jgi:DNA-binding response OmpR family regulator
MLPSVLIIQPSVEAFALSERRLKTSARLVWAQSFEAGLSLLDGHHFDAVLVRADDEASLEFIARVTHQHPATPVVAIALWEVQGDRACALGAAQWLSAPVQPPRLSAVLDAIISARSTTRALSTS